MEESKKKILMICNTSQNIFNFRLPLIKKMQEEGYEVSTITFDKTYEPELKDEGINLYYLEDNNRSLNPFKILTLKKRYRKIIKQINPDIVFTFMLKPNTFGSLAAQSLGIKNVYCMVEGAGDAFINSSLKWKVIKFAEKFLYKKAFKKVKKVFFLNNDDKSEFENLKLVKPEQCVVVNGIGVDLEKFAFKSVNKDSNKFIMIARMLKTKGVLEYCKCAREVRKVHPEAEFMYLGAEGSLKVSDIQEYIDDKSINYLGTVKDVRPFIEDSLALILPSSYREGLPMTIMEAESVGRCIITSNGIGCKETVENGYNGFKINYDDVESMVKKCCELLENKELATILGENARKFAEDKFDQHKINKQILDAVKKN